MVVIIAELYVVYCASVHSAINFENSLFANKVVNPISCFSLNNSYKSIPMVLIIQASDIPDCTSSETMLPIKSMSCEPRARLCRMVDAIRLLMSFSMNTTGIKPFSRSLIRLLVIITVYRWYPSTIS